MLQEIFSNSIRNLKPDFDVRQSFREGFTKKVSYDFVDHEKSNSVIADGKAEHKRLEGTALAMA